MHLKNINLSNFRNYKNQYIDLINGINLFVGDNAQGKTNIIESIYLCAFGKSYRTTKDVEIVKFNSDFSRIELEYNKDNIDKKIELYVDKENKKIIKKDDIKITKIAEHVGEIPVVIFSPDSLDIVKGAPAKRRKFLDMICSQLSKSYLIDLQEYTKCLKMKNSLLKNEKIDDDYISVIHEKMAMYIKKIVSFRSIVTDKLLNKAKVIEKNITNEKEDINIIYETEFLNLEVEQIKEILDKFLYVEKIRKVSIKGIQRDDIKILINDVEVEKYGSQGQNRTAMLTLKLADFEVLMEEKGETPILLLDDIMSELDKNRIAFLTNYIEKYQSIITSTDSSFVNSNISNINISSVKNGNIE